MIVYRFGPDDLLRTRFAISPLLELVGAFYAIRWPDSYVIHRPWALRAAEACAGFELGLFDAATPRGGGYWPVFLGQPPVAPHTTIEAELARVAATPLDLVVAEVRTTYPDQIPDAAQPFVDDPARALADLVDEMTAVWDAALSAHWPAISALLEAEIAARARQLVAGGLAAAFGDLHPDVSWEDGRLTVEPSGKNAADVDLAGRGLLLIPAVFSWPAPWPRTDPPWEPALVYPPSGAATLWVRGQETGDPLGDLLGPGRARLLRALDRPAATTELARRLGVSAGGVSEHLGILVRSGLATRKREGRRVVSSRTSLGDLLCALRGRSVAELPVDR
ncbi:MAG: DUF5937 family protein [Protaetiibacter sp.]